MKHDGKHFLPYRLSFELNAALIPLVRKATSTARSLADQVDRAAESVVLNVAEGMGEYRPKEKARFYRMARRSVSECEAGLRLMVMKRVLSSAEASFALSLCRRLGPILVNLARSVERRAPHPRR